MSALRFLRFELEVGRGLAPRGYAVNREELDEFPSFKGRVLRVVSAPAEAELVGLWCPWPQGPQMRSGDVLSLNFSTRGISLVTRLPRDVMMQVGWPSAGDARQLVVLELGGTVLR